MSVEEHAWCDGPDGIDEDGWDTAMVGSIEERPGGSHRRATLNHPLPNNPPPGSFLDELSCDPEVMEAEAREHAEVPTVDPWLERRSHSFGASEAAALMIATGRRDPGEFPRWVQDLAKPIRVSFGGKWGRTPRLFALKAGLATRKPVGGVARAGSERERALFDECVQLMRRGVLGPGGLFIDPHSMHYSDAAPREWYPLTDRHSKLSATPDSWTRTVFNEHVTVELKCSLHPYDAPPPHYVFQVQVQMAVMDAAAGLLVVGQGWSRDWMPEEDAMSGRVEAWDIPRDDALIAELREAAREGWQEVERLRG